MLYEVITHARILVDLEDAFRGATRTLTLHVPEIDPRGHVITRERSLNVQIPKGIRQGQQIRLAGQGAPGIGQGKPGDLYLEVEFRPHALYSVEGHDLYLNLPRITSYNVCYTKLLRGWPSQETVPP